LVHQQAGLQHLAHLRQTEALGHQPAALVHQHHLQAALEAHLQQLRQSQQGLEANQLQPNQHFQQYKDTK
jgi:NAD(P)H-dependent FMN reductase